MAKAFRILSKTLSTALISVVALLAVLLVGVRLVGLTPYTVISGSMEPTYHVGSIIYVMDIDPTELKVGDPVTFHLPSGTVATHRIVEILNEGTPQLAVRTQGDTNKDPDGITPASAIIGKPVFSIPFLGFVSIFLKQPQGLLCVVGCAAVVMVLSFAIDALFPKEKPSRSEPDGEENVG